MKLISILFLLACSAIVLTQVRHNWNFRGSAVGAIPSNSYSQDEQWELDASLGFPLWIAENFAVNGMSGQPARQEVFLYLENHNFTEANITRIAAHFSAQYDKTAWLEVTIFSDIPMLRRVARAGKNGHSIDLSVPPRGVGETQGLQAQQYSRTTGYYRAYYHRLPYKEVIEYSPDPQSSNYKKIILRNDLLFAQATSEQNALVRAVINNDLSKVEELIAAGVDINTPDRHGWTPLIVAARNGKNEIAIRLISSGANVNACTTEGITPLEIASMFGSLEMVQVLIAGGAKVNVRRDNGFTPLITAAASGNMAIAELLLKHGADVNARDNLGATALMLAYDKPGHSETVDVLLNAGAEVNARDNEGWTALIYAANAGQVAKVESLLKRNADYKPRARNGLTAISAARIIQAADVEEAIQRAMRKR